MHELKVVSERREGYGTCAKFSSSAAVYESFKQHFAILDREEFLIRGRIAPRGAARAQVPRSAARRVPISGGAAESPVAGGRQRGV